MIVGAAIIPSAPLLVTGVSPTLPEGVEAVADAVDAAVDGLAEHELVVLIAVEPNHQGSGQGFYDAVQASLAGLGRPDIGRDVTVHRSAVEQATRITQYPLIHGEPLPLSLSVLTLQLGGRASIVPVTVPRVAEFASLVSVGSGLVEALDDIDERAVLVCAGDLSGGLTPDAPLTQIPGAAEWDRQAVDVVDSGRLDGLERLGPAEAKRVGSLGWAPMSVMHGACARAKLGFVVRHYSAPCGVGYVVASSA